MTIKRPILLMLIILFTCISFTLFSFRTQSKAEIDVTAVNDITESLAEGWSSIEYTELPGQNYGMDYVVLDNENRFIKATREGLNTDLNSAIRNRDTLVDIKLNHQVLGKLIIFNAADIVLQHYRNRLLIFAVGIMIFSATLCIMLLMYVDKVVFRPFRKLQGFAHHVALGNLDMPLEMDKGNIFGAFTESFDLMREELNKARENERSANQSKKELVASLSHDIKTPVASIQAVTEIMYIKSIDENTKKQLEIINSKADQINTLITNIFNATLEELQELKVTVADHSSLIIYDLIKHADYYQRVNISSIPECIILADELRLAQVIDNVISNSYKYAGTTIHVSVFIKGKYLEIAFKDYGSGVPGDEISLIFNKFYRAENSAGKSGAGLGLYIANYLMDKMSGSICCKNTEDGFIVILKLLIT